MIAALHTGLADSGLVAATPSMDRWSFVLAAWLISALVLGAYAVAVLRRARHLADAVPPEQRRWMTASSRRDADDETASRSVAS